MNSQFRSAFIFPLLVLAACTSAPGSTPLASTLPATLAPTAALPASASPLPTGTLPELPGLTPSATLQTLPLTPVEAPAATLAILPAPPSTRTVEAMQIIFPTIIPAEGAEYRPPIYPVPWALSPHDHFYFTSPIAATYPADPVWDYRYGGIYFGPDIIHTGIDLPAPRDTEVMAAAPGTVVWAGYGFFSGVAGNTDDPFGLAVSIRHDFGYQGQPLFTTYAHLSEVDVVLGQWLKAGDVLGNIGETGVTTGPHLHFEVRLGENDFWKTRNPELWLAPSQGYGVLAARIMGTYGTLLDSYTFFLKSLETGHQFTIITYANLNVHSDDYYQENAVIGGLPAGVYEINIPYGALNRKQTIQINPGQVTFFNFYGFSGYDFGAPVIPTPTP